MPRPIRAAFTIPYGAAFGAIRAGGRRRHNGCDYHCPQGTPIYGTETGGVVEHIGYNGDPWMGLGHNISIRYPTGRTIDAHMQFRSPLRVGQTVGPDTLVGYVGLTGNAVNASPPGSHVHHERRKTNGLLVNPENHYGLTTAGSTGTLIGDTLSAAEVTQIKAHMTAEVERLASYVRREARPRLHHNTGNGTVAAIRLETGYVRLFSSEAELELFKANGWVASETPVDLDDATFKGLIAETYLERSRLVAAIVAALPTGSGGTVNLERAVLDAIADIPTATENGAAARAAIIK